MIPTGGQTATREWPKKGNDVLSCGDESETLDIGTGIIPYSYRHPITSDVSLDPPHSLNQS